MGLFDLFKRKKEPTREPAKIDLSKFPDERSTQHTDVSPIILERDSSGNVDTHKIAQTLRKNGYSHHEGYVELKPYHQKTYQQLKNFNDYVVIDTETTGLDKNADEIVEIGIAIVKGGEIIDEYDTLVNPRRNIPSKATAINHITDSDVKDAPYISEVITKVYDMIANKTVVGYNVSFDLAFISRALKESGKSCTIYYADVISTLKNIVNLPNYKLETSARYFGVLDEQAHRAIDDVRATNAVLRKAIELAISQHNEAVKEHREARAAADVERRKKYQNSPLLDKKFVFTGEFELGRENLENMVDSVGALLRTAPNSKTDFLVVGNIKGYPDWAIERKLKKVDDLIANGKPIQKISEKQYIRMIYDARDVLGK